MLKIGIRCWITKLMSFLCVGVYILQILNVHCTLSVTFDERFTFSLQLHFCINQKCTCWNFAMLLKSNYGFVGFRLIFTPMCRLRVSCLPMGDKYYKTRILQMGKETTIWFLWGSMKVFKINILILIFAKINNLISTTMKINILILIKVTINVLTLDSLKIKNACNFLDGMKLNILKPV